MAGMVPWTTVDLFPHIGNYKFSGLSMVLLVKNLQELGFYFTLKDFSDI